MIFHRSIPKRRYQDYTAYRPLLRHDFQFRCAYCLTQEFYRRSFYRFVSDASPMPQEIPIPAVLYQH